MPTVFTGKNIGFSRLYDLNEFHAELNYLASWCDFSRQIQQPIESCVVTDACLAVLTKPCVLVNMRRIAKHFTILSPFYNGGIPSDPLNTLIPRSGPYLSHIIYGIN